MIFPFRGQGPKRCIIQLREKGGWKVVRKRKKKKGENRRMKMAINSFLMEEGLWF